MIPAGEVTPEDVEALVCLALRIARRIARARGMLHHVDDLCGVAQSAVVRAIAGFDPSRGKDKLKAYAAAWIAGEIAHEIEQERARAAVEIPCDDAYAAWSERSAIDQAEDAARDLVDTVLSVCAGQELRRHGEAALLRREAWEALYREIERLAPRDRALVELRYWEGRTWEEVGAALAIDERTARKWDTRIRGELEDGLIAWDRVRPLRRSP